MHFAVQSGVSRKQDSCWVEVNLATLTCWGYYQILDIGVSLTQYLTVRLYAKFMSIVVRM